jgi:uncharacterized protein (TIGR02246 family)
MAGSDVRTSPEALVQGQIDAYNQHDADTFAAAYADDLRLYDLGGELFLFGREALRERYAQVFRDAPQIAVTILKRIVVGDIVIDEERITGTRSGHDAHAAVIYEIAGGLIRRAWITASRTA